MRGNSIQHTNICAGPRPQESSTSTMGRLLHSAQMSMVAVPDIGCIFNGTIIQYNKLGNQKQNSLLGGMGKIAMQTGHFFFGFHI